MLFQKTNLYFLFILNPSLLFSQKPDSLILKIGQMIMVGLPGNAADTSSDFYKDIKDGKVGGISIYEVHLTATNTAENLSAMIRTYQSAAPIPLFVAITQEGGQVNRLKTKYGFPPTVSAQYLGELDNLDSTKYYADNTAFTLSRLGINLDFAPVVDVYMPTNPVLGARERTFSNDPQKIIKHAEQVILSHNYFKVNTALKHFPGHGSSTEDSHLGITDVSKTWKEKELLPYKELMKKGLVKAVMTAHIVNENLDADKLPATLSGKMVNDLLRKQLGFQGVVFADDMQMKAISNEYELKDAVEKAINAGVDVLLFSGNMNGKERVTASILVDIILQLIKEGKIARQRINESYKRIIKMKVERKNL